MDFLICETDCGCGDKADARNCRKPTTCLIRFVPSHDLPIEHLDLPVERLHLVNQRLQSRPCESGNALILAILDDVEPRGDAKKADDLKARGIVCAVKRANVIGARDQRTTSGPAGRQDPHRQEEDMTAPTIIASQQNNP